MQQQLLHAIQYETMWWYSILNIAITRHTVKKEESGKIKQEKEKTWIFKIEIQGRALQQNSSAGIIMSNQSLVLQRIDRQTAGIYTCLATNIEGQGESNALALPVKCKSSSLSNPRPQKKNEMGSQPNKREREREKWWSHNIHRPDCWKRFSLYVYSIGRRAPTENIFHCRNNRAPAQTEIKKKRKNMNSLK